MAAIERSPTSLDRWSDGAVSRTTISLYGVGEIANSARTVLFGVFLLFFYTTVMGLSGTLVGVALAVGLIWTALIDPLVGHLSDQRRGPLGRRHSPMLLGALTMGLLAWAVFSPPHGLAPAVLFTWLLITSLLLRLASAAFIVPYHALGAELSRDYDRRSVVTGARGAFGLVGLMATASLPFVLFFPNRVAGVDPKLDYAGYPWTGLAIGLLMSLTALVATLGTLPSAASGPEQAGTAHATTAPYVIDLVGSFRNRSLRVAVLSVSTMFLGTVVSSALGLHFLTYYARIDRSLAVSAVELAFYGGSLVGIALWLRIIRRFEKRELFLIASVVTALLLLAARLLIGEGRPFGTGDVRPIIVGEALAGLFASIFWIVPASLIADAADEDELDTGRRREGTFFGIFNLGQQVAAGLGALGIGILLDRFAGLVPGQAQQSAETVARLGLLFSVVPAALFFASAILIRGYRLDRQRVDAIQTRLLRRRDPDVGGWMG